MYPYFLDEIGFPATFWVYAGVMVVLMIYGTVSIPENKGQSLVKTEDKMMGVSDKNETHRNMAFVGETKI